MKPKTKLHHQVVELHKQLPEVTTNQRNHAYKSCFEHNGMVMRKTIFCLECSHQWKNDTTLKKWFENKELYDKSSWSKRKSIKPFKATCPSCNKNLEFVRHYDNGARDSAYYQITTTIGDFQVYRMFDVKKYMKKKEQCYYHFSEIVQHWIGPNGSYTPMAVMGTMGGGYYGASWTGYELTVKDVEINNPKYDIIPYRTNPNKKYLPIFKQKGYDGNTYGFSEKAFLSALISSPIFETLLKLKNDSLIKSFINYKKEFIKYWPSIKICLRNNYKIHDFSIWKDYMSLLNYFGKDLRSPKYICPANINKEHDKYVAKRRAIQRKVDAEKTRSKMIADQISYANAKMKFFELMFSKNNIVVEVMKSVQQVMEESDLLLHCAFTNEYHNKKDSLLLSARVNGKVVETIEVSLINMEIIQARGIRNQPSDYNKEIVDLINENMNKIKNLLKPKAKQKSKPNSKEQLKEVAA